MFKIYILCKSIYEQRGARATFFWVRNRNSAIERKHFRNRYSATFKEMLLRNRNSAIPQSQFFLKSATSSPQLGSFNSAIFGLFLAVGSGRFMEKQSGGIKSLATVPLRQDFGFQRNRGFKKYFWLIFKAILMWGKGTWKQRTGRRLGKVAELRKSNLKGPQSQFRNFF